MAFKLADLFVQITGDAKPLSSALLMVQQQLMGMSGLGGRLGASIASGIAGPMLGLGAKGAAVAAGIGLAVMAVAAVTVGLGKAAMMAGHLEEAMSKAEQAFGSGTPKILAAADEMASKFGIVKKTFIDIAASFGLMLEGAGRTRQEAADMSVTLSKLAVDLASYFDVSFSEAIMKLQSGLAGEVRAVREWGINVSEAAVEQKAMVMGLAKTHKELTEGAKVMARYQIILEGTKAAQGDMERTGGHLVLQWEKFTGQLYNIATAVGSVVKPAFTALLTGANFVLSGISSISSGISGALGFLANKISQCMYLIYYGLKQLGVVDLVTGIASAVSSVVSDVAGFIGSILSTLGGMFAWLNEKWDNFLASLGYGAADTGDAARQAAIDARIDQTTAQQRAEEAAAAANKKPEKAFRGGLEDYAKKIAEAAAGSKDNVAKQQLAAAKQGNNLLGQIAVAVQKPAGAAVALAN